ncbi:phage Gp37/Gp68 family protein [bacterium]|nr:phage Gp37/Gp68 family protein [bacterium]
MEYTEIAWTTHTFNGWEGCSKVSSGCKFCYASGIAKRFESNRGVIWGPHGTRVRTSEQNWKKPLTWNRKAEKNGERYRVFTASMSDVFEENWDEALDPWRTDLFDLIETTPNLDWQILTKRPAAIAPTLKRLGYPKDFFLSLGNVWLGTSTENADWARRRIPPLTKIPAAVHFISAEPLLGPIPNLPLDHIEWVIVGGESGPKARPMEADWVREIRDQCLASGTPFFFKQWGGARKKLSGKLLEAREWTQIPTRTLPKEETPCM